MRDMHLVLKYKKYVNNLGESESVKIDTALEHKQVLDGKRRLIWGQSSKINREGIAKDGRDRIKEQVKANKSSYVFFLPSVDKKTDENEFLYVGKINDVYTKDQLKGNKELIQFIPSYYASKVAEGSDNSNILIDVSSFMPVHKNILKKVIIESSQVRFNEMPRNTTPLFKVNIDDDLLDYLENLHSQSEQDFQTQVEIAIVEENTETIDQPHKLPGKIQKTSTESFVRSPEISKKAIVSANYTCEIDETHKHFTSRITNKNYVEAHHLIPMKYQSDFSHSIDVESNIVSICTVCHKKLHHGLPEEIKEIVELLHQKRTERMRKSGIEITISDLLNYY